MTTRHSNDSESCLIVPGIGPETAARLLAEMPQLGEFDSARAATSHTGLTPKRHQSGTSINAPSRISKIGNSRVRHALYLPAMAALRSSKEFKELASRLTERGKKKMQIIAAAMHKLVRIAHGASKNQRPYDPNYAARLTTNTVSTARGTDSCGRNRSV